MKSEYDFCDLCKDIRKKLPSNLHTTQEGKNYIWSAMYKNLTKLNLV